MNRVHIIGGKNHGKTTLIVELVGVLSSRGLRIGTIKHTHHHHELDTPGKDSHRHRVAGAAVVGICSPAMNAAFWSPRGGGRYNTEDSDVQYAEYEPIFEQCDLVLVEGDSGTSALKLEIWRSEIGTPPFAESDASISAVITDDMCGADLGIPSWPRSDLAAIARNLLSLMLPQN